MVGRRALTIVLEQLDVERERDRRSPPATPLERAIGDGDRGHSRGSGTSGCTSTRSRSPTRRSRARRPEGVTQSAIRASCCPASRHRARRADARCRPRSPCGRPRAGAREVLVERGEQPRVRHVPPPLRGHLDHVRGAPGHLGDPLAEEPAGAHDHRVAALDEVRDPRLHSRRPGRLERQDHSPTPRYTRRSIATRSSRMSWSSGSRCPSIGFCIASAPRVRRSSARAHPQQPLGWGKGSERLDHGREGSHTRPCLQTKKNLEPIGLAYIFLRAVAVTVTQLSAFLAVVRLGSVTAAAEELVVTQPSVSAAVAALNARLG